MLADYGPLLVLLIAALAFPIGGIFASWFLGVLRLRPNNPGPVKNDTYECGMETIGSSWVQFNFRYYTFALLFVVFDIEAVFLLPWAVYFRQLQLFGLIEMAIFILILVVGYVYAWRKRALEWV
ncbi:MAG TPA: NADH-quinone oxidoreductase subunit A [Dehalococcoidia bacterium]|nr:NADH-quinone oxidoreductase subunit A [Dehalococcoidia bacterium]